jgi:spermidine/putrescine transport system ATP-binding protein
LQQLQRRLGITFIFVTHDQEEALVMSDRIAVMNAGKIQQLDAVEPLYEKPRTRFVAEFLGSCNLLDARVQSIDGASNAVMVETAMGNLKVLTSPGSASLTAGKKITLAIRPEKLQLQLLSAVTEENTLRARIENLVYCGAETQYRLNTGALTLSASAMNAAPGLAIHRVGHEVRLYLPPAALVILED